MGPEPDMPQSDILGYQLAALADLRALLRTVLDNEIAILANLENRDVEAVAEDVDAVYQVHLDKAYADLHRSIDELTEAGRRGDLGPDPKG
ncbi:MAG: hypothetical protein ABJF88_17865 [Rhodothermales bacterium]